MMQYIVSKTVSDFGHYTRHLSVLIVSSISIIFLITIYKLIKHVSLQLSKHVSKQKMCVITPCSCEMLSCSVDLSSIILSKYRANSQSLLQSDVKRASLFSSMYAVPMIKQMSGQSCQLRSSLWRREERKEEREENRAQIGRSPNSFAYQDVVGLRKFPSWCEGRVKSHIRVQTTHIDQAYLLTPQPEN